MPAWFGAAHGHPQSSTDSQKIALAPNSCVDACSEPSVSLDICSRFAVTAKEHNSQFDKERYKPEKECKP